MNYIRHLNQFFDKVREDERLTPFHVSLYMALFQQWNQSHFRESISIARDEIKKLAKIGSNNTYSKCLNNLHQWKYICYVPSYYKHTGSKVKMYIFDTGTDIGSDTGGDPKVEMTYTSDIGSDTGTDTGAVQVVRPYINNIKPIKTLSNDLNKLEEDAKSSNLKMEGEEVQKDTFPDYLKNRSDAAFLSSPLTGMDEQPREKKKVAQKKKSEDVTAAEHAFCQSPYFSVSKLREALAGTDYAHANLQYYHEVVNNWSESKGAKKKDWLATIKNWILRDVQAGKLVKAEQPLSNNPYDNERFRERVAKYSSIWNRGKVNPS